MEITRSIIEIQRLDPSNQLRMFMSYLEMVYQTGSLATHLTPHTRKFKTLRR